MKLYNGLELPDMGYGTFPQKETLIDTIPWALDAGYRLIDTSDNYDNQEFIGKAVTESILCDQCIIITKASFPLRISSLEDDFYKSKELLGIPRDRPVGLFLIHFPYPHLYMDMWKIMEKLYEEGQCLAIGVCNFQLEHLQKLMKICKIKPMVNQTEIHPMFRQLDVCRYCQDNGIAIMSYSPLARMNPKLTGNDTLKEIAKKYGKEVTQVVLRWDMQHAYIPLPAASKNDHIRSNWEAHDFELTQEEMDRIDRLDCGMRIRYNPQTMFGPKYKLRCLLRHMLYRLAGSRKTSAKAADL